MSDFDDHPLTSNQFDYHETGNVSDKRKGPTVRPTLNRSTASRRRAMYAVASPLILANQSENAMKIGDTVRKTKGYPFPGVVVADFTNYKGERRLVVEARHPDILGCLHIYNPEQLEVVK